VGSFLGKAGKNFLESGQLDVKLPDVDLDFGVPTKKKGKKKKAKEFDPFDF
jgi:hypothetical protein